MSINKKTLNSMNISQNNIIRYMTELSKHSHISNTRKTLRILSIDELFVYMKLVFIKNLENNIICQRIFNHILVLNCKKNSKSFIRGFKNVCVVLQSELTDIINNIHTLLKK